MFVYSGFIFFRLLIILNHLINVCDEINNYLVFMTTICLIFPNIQKQNPWTKSSGLSLIHTLNPNEVPLF